MFTYWHNLQVTGIKLDYFDIDDTYTITPLATFFLTGD